MRDTTRVRQLSGRSSRRELIRTVGLRLPMALIGGLLPRSSAASQTASRAAARSQFLEVNGVKLHCLEWGPTDAPPLILLHAAPLNARVWEAFGRSMAPHYRVVAPDARGFGDSQWSDAYSDDLFVEDLRALVIALGLRQPILCGNSMGGTLAYYYAGMYADDVSRLILVDTGPGEKPDAAAGPAGSRPGGPPPMPAGPFSSPEEAAARVPAAFGQPFIKAMIQHNLRQAPGGQWHWKHDPRVMGAAERSARDPRKWPRWLAVRCPSLVLRGERSPALPQRIAEQMVSENSHASLVVVPNAAHFIPLEQPAAFETAIRTWLGLR